MRIKTNVTNIKNKLKNAQLVVVTKHQNLDDIKKVYQLGERDFGENKVQDLINKRKELPSDIRWHMIGHLQTNKVKLIIPFIHMIQSVDSIKLLKTINKYAIEYNRQINCLIQIKIAEEKSKYGLSIDAALKLFNSNYLTEYPNINICGIMAMATFTNNQEQIAKEFQSLINIQNHISDKHPILSIGMSGDYEIAVKCGSNMVRLGSAIFQ